ncbi:MAG TPA: NADH-ubiquinone oxidoreductase-F iron-sulfur binding region domain-containing protein [Dehalococcoidia bacterium]|nr:NADH-ubiquinone oxidoreductase-F iron-sulfur binding region domain-containing protein [Dehalococcoidia bacterium]
MSAFKELQEAALERWRLIEEPQRPLIRIAISTCSLAVGAAETLERLREELGRQRLVADLTIVGCPGLCFAEPLLEVHMPGLPRLVYGNVTPQKVAPLLEAVFKGEGVAKELVLGAITRPGESMIRYMDTAAAGIPALGSHEWLAVQDIRLMENCGLIDPEEIDHYIARGGYEGLNKALSMKDEEVIKQVNDSGLSGRGGAAFPTGRKWDFLRQAPGTVKYMVCNADEGDPGSFVNRNLMEGNPHSIIEGMAIGGYAAGASYGFVYIRDEYPLSVQRMESAIKQAREKGVLGENIFGSGFSYNMEVVRGAGSYVCGEETGLIASIEDIRGMPKIRPPFPAQAGVFGKPTNVNNVETYANVPLILRRGARWYASAGTEKHKGTKMFSLSGQVKRVGVLEVPLGTPLRDLVLTAAGGVPSGHNLKAVQPGGPLSGIVPASDVIVPGGIGILLEPDAFRERGMFMGSGGLVVLDDSNCILELCRYFEWFAETESCGRCTTCFAGTRRLVEILNRISNGEGQPADRELIQLLGDTMRNANCVHGQAAPTAVQSMLRFFEDELNEHLLNRRCPSQSCRGLVRYEVKRLSDRLEQAANICPTGAVIRNGDNYHIDQNLCIKCDACRELAPDSIEIVDDFPAVGAVAAEEVV